jgi:hypothetical protein
MIVIESAVSWLNTVVTGSPGFNLLSAASAV